jgi:polyhydroxyalkanoate synthesis regulator phasin
MKLEFTTKEKKAAFEAAMIRKIKQLFPDATVVVEYDLETQKYEITGLTELQLAQLHQE